MNNPADQLLDSMLLLDNQANDPRNTDTKQYNSLKLRASKELLKTLIILQDNEHSIPFNSFELYTKHIPTIACTIANAPSSFQDTPFESDDKTYSLIRGMGGDIDRIKNTTELSFSQEIHKYTNYLSQLTMSIATDPNITSNTKEQISYHLNQINKLLGKPSLELPFFIQNIKHLEPILKKAEQQTHNEETKKTISQFLPFSKDLIQNFFKNISENPLLASTLGGILAGITIKGIEPSDLFSLLSLDFPPPETEENLEQNTSSLPVDPPQDSPGQDQLQG